MSEFVYNNTKDCFRTTCTVTVFGQLFILLVFFHLNTQEVSNYSGFSLAKQHSYIQSYSSLPFLYFSTGVRDFCQRGGLESDTYYHSCRTTSVSALAASLVLGPQRKLTSKVTRTRTTGSGGGSTGVSSITQDFVSEYFLYLS